MNPAEIAAIFSPYAGVDSSALHFLRYSQNWVFSYTAGGQGRILRVAHGDHRTRSEIAAELEWVRHLHGAGAPVAAPAAPEIASMECDGITLHGVIFEKAPGRALVREDVSPELSRAHGRALGMIHRCSAGLVPAWAAGRKPWEAERYFSRDIDGYIPAEHRQPLRDVFERLRSRISAAPRYASSLGPVHFDLGYSNFFVDGDRLTVFDFDNCTAAPRIADIAAALYGSIFTLLRCEFPGDRSAFSPPGSSRILHEILPAFREGYESMSAWPDDWETQLQPWLDILYFRSVIHAWRVQSPVTNPRIQAALEADIPNILNGTTPVAVGAE